MGVALLLLNGVAWMQARAMTHYADAVTRTDRPEALSLPEKAWVLLTGVTVPRPITSGTPDDLSLRYETRTIGVGNGESLEAWYVPSDGAPGLVLMFPGYAESKSSLLAPAAALHSMGWATLMVDFRGAGGSNGSNTTLGVHEASDVAAAAQYARGEWPNAKIILYGVSMGSAAVLRAVAIHGVEADALIVESPFDTLLNTVRNRFNAMGLPQWPGAELVVFWGGVQLGIDGFAHSPSDYARQVRAPTLLMHGERDPRVTLEQAQAVYNGLGGPRQFVQFPGAGHESLINSAPELWKGYIRQFISQIARGY